FITPDGKGVDINEIYEELWGADDPQRMRPKVQELADRYGIPVYRVWSLISAHEAIVATEKIAAYAENPLGDDEYYEMNAQGSKFVIKKITDAGCGRRDVLPELAEITCEDSSLEAKYKNPRD